MVLLVVNLYLKIMKNKWKEITGKKVRTFQLNDDPEIFYLIPLRLDEYMVVHEDAFDLNTGKVEFFNGNELKEKYGINYKE